MTYLHEMARIGFSMALVSLLSGTSFAAKSDRVLIGSSGTKRVQLLEVFSSEGCSSCPPADQWVSNLAHRADLWKNFVPVVYHVDYWNNLGWKDQWSSPEMTARQRSLASRWPEEAVYTPAMIVDGQQWLGWRRADQPNVPGPNSGIEISLYKTGASTVAVTVKGQKPGHQYRLRIAELGMSRVSKVTRGENSGQELKHDFVLLNWSSQGLKSGESEVTFHLEKAPGPSEKLSLAAWIEDEQNPAALQATGGPLS